MAEFREYLRVIQALLKGGETDYSLNGETHTIGFQNKHLNYIQNKKHFGEQMQRQMESGQQLSNEQRDAAQERDR